MKEYRVAWQPRIGHHSDGSMENRASRPRITSFSESAVSVLVALLAFGAVAVSAAAAEVRVYSGGAPQVVLRVLAPDFERTTGHKLQFTYAVVGEIRKRLAAGEKADVILLPVPLMDSLDKGQVLRPESQMLLARVGISVIVREGAARPDISNPEAVRKALLNARSIAYSDPKLTPGGKYLAGMMSKLGIAEAVDTKTTRKNAIDGGSALVANGDVELGMYLLSEVQSIKGITVVGLLPAQLQNYVVYASALGANGDAADPARAFQNFLHDPANHTHWRAAGFEPLGGSR